MISFHDYFGCTPIDSRGLLCPCVADERGAEDVRGGKVMARKKNRLASIGPDVVLSFEDRTTILYQVQEMLRVERIFQRGSGCR